MCRSPRIRRCTLAYTSRYIGVGYTRIREYTCRATGETYRGTRAHAHTRTRAHARNADQRGCARDGSASMCLSTYVPLSAKSTSIRIHRAHTRAIYVYVAHSTRIYTRALYTDAYVYAHVAPPCGCIWVHV